MKFYRLIGLSVFCLALSCLAGEPPASGQSAADLAREAQKAEHDGQTVRAYLLYAEAAAKDPDNPSYWTHAQALRPMATMAKPEIGAVMGTLSDEKPVKPAAESDIDPAVVGNISEWDIVEAKRHPLPPAELKAAPGPKDFDLKGDSKELFENVAAAFNLMVVFDSGYQPVQRIHFEITGADYRQALRALQDATNSFVVPVADRLILVANDTPQKRRDLESVAAVVLPVPDAVDVKEVQELATAIRGTLEIRRLMVDSTKRLVLIRDAVWKVRAAEMLLHDLMQPRPQVAIEIDIVTLDESKSKTWGLDLPTEFPLVYLGRRIIPVVPGGGWHRRRLRTGATGSSPSSRWQGLSNLLPSIIPSGFFNFMTFGGGASFFGLGVTSATLFATATEASTTNLLKADVVTSDGVPASFHSGQKYPLVTSSYAFSGVGSGGFVPPPQFNFEDLGLILKITPHVHGMDEMSLEVDAEFKLLGASTIDNIPVIADRKLESKVRLRDGEWAVLAGLATKSEIKQVTGIPGLMLIPFLRKNSSQEDRSDTLIVLKPHLLNMPPTEALTHIDWIGTETRGRTL